MSTASVIVTSDKQAQFVVQAVESVLAQTFRDIEIIVVGHGGADGIPEALAMHRDQITYIRQRGQDVMTARSSGLQASKGMYLLFMRADDLLPPKKVELQIKQLAAHPKLGLAYFGGQIQVGDAIQIIREVEINQPNALTTMEFLFSGCPLIRRECLERAELLRIPQCMDAGWNPWHQISLADYEIDPQERLILGKEHLTIFLQRLHRGDISGAQRHMIEAVRVSPSLLKEPRAFINSVFDYAKRPDVNDPVAFAQTVLDNLPDCAQGLKRNRGRIIAELSIARSFQSYTLGNMVQVRRSVVAGLRYNLSYLMNKGVVSIFCKSLINQNGKSRFAAHGDREIETLRWVIKDIQETLSQSVDNVEPTVSGTERNTYVIRSGGRPFILRLGIGQSGRLALSRVITVVERVRAAGVPAPSIRAYNIPAQGTSEPAWIVEEWIPGYSFIPQGMLWRNAHSIATELGQCLRRLHSIETRGFGMISSEHFDAAHQTFAQWLDGQILTKCRTLDMLPIEVLSRIEASCQFLRESSQESPRLCHFDLHGWNLLINRGCLSAIIDWDGVYGCDPVLDVASVHFWSADEQILTALLQGYAPIQPEVFWHRVMAGVICYSAYLLTIDLQPTIDKQEVYHQCLRWLTDSTQAY
jgi:aminoglycoside phosphotransferase (APT) family kinase protein/glycosyltransferase involved in cell wall biosynthesis